MQTNQKLGHTIKKQLNLKQFDQRSTFCHTAYDKNNLGKRIIVFLHKRTLDLASTKETT